MGSRGSRLAMWQTEHVVQEIQRLTPGLCCRVRVIKTTGDRIQNVPLAGVGDKGLFVKQIEQALLAEEIDVAVHSAKDLPPQMDPRLCVAAYPVREDPSDALVSRQGRLSELPHGAVVGTSSARRRAQLLHSRPDLRVVDLRGNLDTRLRKLDDGGYAAVVLALAGLRRMGWESRITQVMPFDICLPAAGQGALAVQCRTGDHAHDAVSGLDDPVTRRCVGAERSMLARLGAGCQTPVAVLARESENRMEIDALVASPDGSQVIRISEAGDPAQADDMGARLAERLLDSPARGLLEEARHTTGPNGMGAA